MTQGYGARRGRCTIAAVLQLWLVAPGASAQPDPRQMSGIPRPDLNLPDGQITVRVIRGSFANNVLDHPVDLRAGDAVTTANTDQEGRARFNSLSPGARVSVAATLDGEELVSQSFPAPGRGGVAIVLVGTAGDAADVAPVPPAGPGRVTLSQDSRILIELGEENIEVYYLLDVFNIGDGRVEPQPAFEFTLPSGAQSGTVLQGSISRTLVDGLRVWVAGGFDPGVTPVHIAYVLPYSGGSLALEQGFPADFEQLLVFVEQWGDLGLASAQIERRGEMEANATGGSALLWGAGRRVPVGEPVALELSGLPHHPGWPRILALSLSGMIIALAMWMSVSVPPEDESQADRETLRRRREKLFTELVKVERQHSQGKIGPTRFGTRRAELINQLQRVLLDLNEGLAPPVTRSLTPDRTPA